jgi:hypothetical protein
MGHLHAICSWRTRASSVQIYPRWLIWGTSRPIQSCDQCATDLAFAAALILPYNILTSLTVSLLLDLLEHIAPQATRPNYIWGSTLLNTWHHYCYQIRFSFNGCQDELRRKKHKEKYCDEHLVSFTLCATLSYCFLHFSVTIVHVLKLHRLVLCYDGNRLSFAVLLI